MAVKGMDFFSDCLRRRVEYHVAMPDDCMGETAEAVEKRKQLKVLVFLHGYCEMGIDFLEKTDIEQLAGKYRLCVILPNGENSFYLDGKATGRQYGTYVGVEIPDHARSVLGLSDKREDAFIGGTSMGGFGAIHTGLFFPERYAGIFGMSSALIMDFVADREASMAHGIANQEYYDLMFGPAEELLTGTNDPRELIRRLKTTGGEIPRIYITCGTSDFMIEQSRAFDRFLTEQEVPHTYVEAEGAHNFEFWKPHMEQAICGAMGR